jgi:hypothetical protein
MALAPANDVTLAASSQVRLSFLWTTVQGADGYMLEVQEWSGTAWVEQYRTITRTTSLALDLQPTRGGAVDLRWRVRTAVGRRGSRPSAWQAIHLR